VGLTLVEAKQLMARLQQLIVREQLLQHNEQARACAVCGTRRSVKDYRDRRIATVLGTGPREGAAIPRVLSVFWREGLHVPRFGAVARSHNT
jgi:hypothetical protein